MKILLVNPPETIRPGGNLAVAYPLGLMYTASVLREEGHKVGILDALASGWKSRRRISNGFEQCGLGWREIKHRIESFRPELVGVTCHFTSQAKNAYRIAEAVKEVDGKILVLLGGPHASATPLAVMKNRNIDFVCVGEGEHMVPKLIQCLEGRRDLSSVLGLAYRDGKGRIHRNRNRHPILKLDDLPFPAYDLVDMDSYFEAGAAGFSTRFGKTEDRWVTMITSRGCPFTCSFCSIHLTMSKVWRGRSPENVVNEMEMLIEKYNVREFQFEDDNLTWDKKRAERIFDEIISRRLDIKWITPNGVRVDTLDKELLLKMKRSGCHFLIVGAESGVQRVLDEVIKKKQRVEAVEKVAEWAQEVGIKLGAFFVLGMPGETKEEILRTLEFARRLYREYGVEYIPNIAIPLPGTEMYHLCEEKGYLAREPTPENYLLAEVNPMIKTEEFTPEELMHWHLKTLYEIYPPPVKSLLLDPKNWAYIARNPGKVWRFIKSYVVGRINRVRNL